MHTEIEIAAPALRVWEMLTDFSRYPEWNPSLRSVAREPAVGERLVVQFSMGRGRTMAMRPRLLAVDAPRELR